MGGKVEVSIHSGHCVLLKTWKEGSLRTRYNQNGRDHIKCSKLPHLLPTYGELLLGFICLEQNLYLVSPNRNQKRPNPASPWKTSEACSREQVSDFLWLWWVGLVILVFLDYHALILPLFRSPFPGKHLCLS